MCACFTENGYNFNAGECCPRFRGPSCPPTVGYQERETKFSDLVPPSFLLNRIEQTRTRPKPKFCCTPPPKKKCCRKKCKSKDVGVNTCEMKECPSPCQHCAKGCGPTPDMIPPFTPVWSHPVEFVAPVASSNLSHASPTIHKLRPAGLPSKTCPPFDPCTGQECCFTTLKSQPACCQFIPSLPMSPACDDNFQYCEMPEDADCCVLPPSCLGKGIPSGSSMSNGSEKCCSSKSSLKSCTSKVVFKLNKCPSSTQHKILRPKTSCSAKKPPKVICCASEEEVRPKTCCQGRVKERVRKVACCASEEEVRPKPSCPIRCKERSRQVTCCASQEGVRERPKPCCLTRLKERNKPSTFAYTIEKYGVKKPNCCGQGKDKYPRHDCLTKEQKKPPEKTLSTSCCKEQCRKCREQDRSRVKLINCSTASPNLVDRICSSLQIPRPPESCYLLLPFKMSTKGKDESRQSARSDGTTRNKEEDADSVTSSKPNKKKEPKSMRNCGCNTDICGNDKDTTDKEDDDNNDNKGSGSCCTSGCCYWPRRPYFYNPYTGRYYCYSPCCYYNGCCSGSCGSCGTSCPLPASRGKSAKSKAEDSKSKSPKDSKTSSPKGRTNSPKKDRISAGGVAQSQPEVDELYERWMGINEYAANNGFHGGGYLPLSPSRPPSPDSSSPIFCPADYQQQHQQQQHHHRKKEFKHSRSPSAGPQDKLS